MIAAAGHAARQDQARPNIIFILTDDLGYGDVGVFFQNSRKQANDLSNPWHLTPELDRFAAEGAQLLSHYSAAPVCAPSRASLLLGVSQGHANVRDNQFDKALANNHTIATVLKQAGYATVAIGKWGIQGREKGETDPATWPAFPTKRGFDHFFGYARHVDGHEHYPKEAPYVKVRDARARSASTNKPPKDAGVHKSMPVWDGTINVTPDLDKCYTADLWTAWAKQWIVAHKRAHADQPFFMYLAYDTPHAVQQLPTQAYPAGGGLTGGLQWLGKPGQMINTASGEIDSYIYPEYRDATHVADRNAGGLEVPWPDVYKRYATAVRRIDDAVGDLQKLLKDLHIDQDTLVVFTSDNGASLESYLPESLSANFFESFGPFDGIKRDLLEGGIRVATLVRWPGRVPAGKIVTSPSINYDWLPTFAQVAGVPVPARADGVSLLPELTGRGVQRDRSSLYVEYVSNNSRTPNYPEFTPGNRNRLRNQMQVLRIGDYVGVRYDIKSHADPFEIYQVTVDSKQAENLASTRPELEQKMRNLVLQVRRPDPDAPRPYDQQPVPASNPGAVVAGVEWRAFEGDFPWVPQFETLTPVASGTASQPDLKNLPTKKNGGLFFTGYLKIPKEGDYTFYLTVDSGALLRLHEATVIDADFGYTGDKEMSGSIRLEAGLHPFRLYYARKPGVTAPSQLNFEWSGPGIDRQSVPAAVLVRQAH
jgi:arylsulfatase A-like enzyme